MTSSQSPAIPERLKRLPELASDLWWTWNTQAREVFRCIKANVEAGGGRMENIVKLNTYVTDIRYRADLVPVREEAFGKKGPASTLVEVSALAHPDWLIEVEAIAVV